MFFQQVLIHERLIVPSYKNQSINLNILGIVNLNGFHLMKKKAVTTGAAM